MFNAEPDHWEVSGESAPEGESMFSVSRPSQEITEGGLAKIQGRKKVAQGWPCALGLLVTLGPCCVFLNHFGSGAQDYATVFPKTRHRSIQLWMTI